MGGKQCELRQCKQKRYAAPEGSSTMSSSRKRASACNKRRATATIGNKCKRRSVSKSIVKFCGDEIYESRFQASPFKTYSRPYPDGGLNTCEIKTVCLPATNNKSFFSQRFENRIYRVEKSLRDAPPEKIVTHVSSNMQ
jgi:hypothetical protein